MKRLSHLLAAVSLLAMSVLATGQTPPSTVNPAPRSDAWWQKRHESFNRRTDLLFIGDSITQAWEGPGKDVWARRYAPRRALNLGISGDQTQHVLWRLDHGNVDGIGPKAAVIMIGTNNMAANPPPEIAQGIEAIVKKLREKLPETRILLLAIFPRSEKPDAVRAKVSETNAIIAKLADDKSIFFLDIGPHFLQPDGTISKDIMPDFLHLTPKLYEIWGEAIEPKLKELLGEK